MDLRDLLDMLKCGGVLLLAVIEVWCRLWNDVSYPVPTKLMQRTASEKHLNTHIRVRSNPTRCSPNLHS